MKTTFYEIAGITVVNHWDTGLHEVEYDGRKYGRDRLTEKFREHYHKFCRRFPGTGITFGMYMLAHSALVRRYITAFGYTQAETDSLITDLLNALHRDGVLSDASYSRLAVNR